MATFRDSYVDIDHRSLFGLGPKDGVTRLFADGSEKFVSNAQLAKEEAEERQRQEEELARLLAEQHDEEMREEGSDEQFERMISALARQFPDLPAEINRIAKQLKISRKEALKEILELENEVEEIDEQLDDYRALGYKG